MASPMTWLSAFALTCLFLPTSSFSASPQMGTGTNGNSRTLANSGKTLQGKGKKSAGPSKRQAALEILRKIQSNAKLTPKDIKSFSSFVKGHLKHLLELKRSLAKVGRSRYQRMLLEAFKKKQKPSPRSVVRILIDRQVIGLRAIGFPKAGVTMSLNPKAKSALRFYGEILEAQVRMELLEKSFQVYHQTRFHNTNITGQVLQVLGRIVLKRSTQAAMQTVLTILTKSLKCDEKGSFGKIPFRFKDTCLVLNTVPLRSLLTKPQALLDALLKDVFANLLQRLQSTSSSAAYRQIGKIFQNFQGEIKALRLKELLQKLIDAWRNGKQHGIAQVAYEHVKAAVMKRAHDAECSDIPASTGKSKPYIQALWVVAQCAMSARKKADSSSVDFHSAVSSCELEPLVGQCKPGEKKDTVTRLAQILLSFLSIDLRNSRGGEKAKAIVKPVLHFYFFALKEVIKDAAPAARMITINPQSKTEKRVDVKEQLLQMAEGLESIFVGVIERDWLIVATGASSAFAAVFSMLAQDKSIATHDQARQALLKLFKLAAAIGQYAETYKPSSSKSIEELQKLRQNIIESLIDATTDRSSREQGFVVSLGGSFGFAGGGRFTLKADKSLNIGFFAPFALPLGLGLQGYSDCPVNLHLQLSFFDLGQYVSFDGLNGDVSIPNFQDAFSISLTVGLWFRGLNRSFPIFAAAHIGISPFQLRNKIPAFYAGGMLGIYVPFFDFN